MLKTDVLRYFGSKSATAQMLAVTPSAISQWKEVIPEKQAYKIEKISNGELKVNPNFYNKNNK